MEKYVFSSPFLKDFHPDDYHFFGLWKQNIFSMSFWVSCFDKEIIERLGLKSDGTKSLMLHEGNFFIEKDEIESIKKQVAERIDAGDEAFFQNMKDVADDVYKEMVAWAESHKDQEVSPEAFENFSRHAKRINFLWLLGAEHLSIATEEIFQDAVVQEHVPAEVVPLLVPPVVSLLTEQGKEVLQLKELIGDMTFDEAMASDTLRDRMQDHVLRYVWIEMANFAGNVLTPERLYEQIVHAKKNDQENVPPPRVSDALALRARCFSYCGYIKQAGAEYFFMFSEKMLPFLRRVAVEMELSYDEFLFLREGEILSFLRGEINSSSIREIISRRASFNVFLFNEGESCIEDASDISLLKSLLLPKIDANTEIRGQVANKGFYRGRVCVVMHTPDFYKMQPGDVLVSTMTTPDFVVLMQKSGAIVTDIGGMLCHAAIVSREINKPCIIGTKIATKMLKDGDEVEVDAEKGIVRILRKA